MKTKLDELKEQVKTALNGLAASGSTFPAELKGKLDALVTGVNEKLGAIQFPESPTAADVARVTEWCVSAIVEFQKYVSEANANVTRLGTELSGKVAELAGLNERVTKGELVEKGAAQALIAAAGETARNAARAELLPAIVGGRKSVVEACGLPVPDETILGAADFDAQVTQAKANATALLAKGIGPQTNWAKATIWKPATEFAGAMEQISDLAITAPKQKPAGDPLAGGGGGGKGGICVC